MKMNGSNLILASVVSASMAAVAMLASPVAFASSGSPVRTGSVMHAAAARTVAGTADDDKKGDSKGSKSDSKSSKDKQKTKTEKPAPAPSGGGWYAGALASRRSTKGPRISDFPSSLWEAG